MADSLPAALGHGNWKNFNLPLETVYAAAGEWRQALSGVERPWLCWNVSARWCVLQQRLAREAGWTPVVGFDPRAGAPPVEPGAVLIDFNRHFQFPVMFFMFPLEFVFLFAPRLAFWHADLLCRTSRVRELAATFEALKDGEMAAVLPADAATRCLSGGIASGSWPAAPRPGPAWISFRRGRVGGAALRAIPTARMRGSGRGAKSTATISASA